VGSYLKQTNPDNLQSSLLPSVNLDLTSQVGNADIHLKNPKLPLKLGRSVKFPFSLKLGLALSVLSVGVATTSIFWLQSSIQRNLLKNQAKELKLIGIKESSSFSSKDIAEIKNLAAQINSQSLKLSQQELNLVTENTEFPGLSKEVHDKIVASKRYQNLARKLGEITNYSRRDESSDIYIRASYLITTVPEFPDRKIVRLLASDKGYRYEGNSPKINNDYVGYYYSPGSLSIRPAFDGKPQVDSQYYYEYKNRQVAYISTAVPLKDDKGKVVAVLNLDVDVSSLAIEIDSIKWTCLQIIGTSLFISLVAGSLISNWLVRPIRKLYQASEKIRNHNFDVAVEVKSHDEFQQLAEAFNAMVAEVSRYTNNLESLVEVRTDLLNKAKNELETDIEKGQKLQINFLPNPILTVQNWEICAAFQPAKKVAGDFYDVFPLPNGSIALVIADVCDKGVGAAMFMGLFRSFIRLFSGGTNFKFSDREATDSTAGMELEFDFYQRQALQAIEITNNYISEEHGETGMFATMFFGVLNPETGLLTYINGGHESPLIINASGIKTALKSTGPAVGMMPNMKFKIKQVQLEPGDILFGYTDGLTDARSPNKEFFTEKRVLSLVNQPYSSASELLERMKTDVFTHIDSAPQFDDITLLAVRRKIPGTS